MKNIKTIISLVLVMAMMSCVALATEYGNESTIIIHGKNGTENSAEFITDDTALTETDLFDNFKNVMPGDTLEEKIVVRNEWDRYDYIRLYLTLDLHDEENPLEVEGTTIEEAHEFLSQLTMRIYDDNDDGKLVFESTPETQGELIEEYSLGRLKRGQEFAFTVELEIPVDLDNEFANRLAEVDWVFTYSGRNYPEDPTTTAPPIPPTISPVEPTEPTINIEDPEIPLVPAEPGGAEIIPSSPDTGDHSNMLPYIVLFIVGLMGLILTSKKRKTN